MHVWLAESSTVNKAQLNKLPAMTTTAFGRLELECCERKILLPGWWLEARTGGM
jgi:hypothetical protein